MSSCKQTAVELYSRQAARVDGPRDPQARQAAGRWARSRIDAAVAAADRQPQGTLILRSDRLTPPDLANEVLALAGLSQLE